MTKFATSSRKKPCPVCDRTKDGDCRISQNGELVLCHSHIEGKKGDTINGYVWIGEVKEPLNWGKWVVPSAEPFKNPNYRPVDQEYRFDYTNAKGTVICAKVRVYQKQPDGSVKKRDRWEPTGIESADLLPYRYLVAIEKLNADPTLPLFIDESEMTADELWKMGLPAIAFGRSLSTPRIRQLLSGFESRLVICQDQDQVGVQKAAKYLKLFPMAATLRPYPESDFWMPEWLPESGGLDVRDWILEGGLTREEILGSVGALRVEPTGDDDADNSVADELDHLNGLNGLSKPQVLPDALDAPISKLADRLNLPKEAFISVFLSVAGSLLNPRTRLALDPTTGFYAPPIFWMGIVGESGTKKSPLLRAITNPLDALQERAEILYQDAMDAYEQEILDWEATPKEKRGKKATPPIPGEYYLSDFTMEALGGVLGNPTGRGVLVNVDELARFFTSMDAYRGGKGGDRQHWLSFYDGGAFKSNRKSTGRVYARRTSVSLTGGIQPSVLQRIWSEDKSSEDGLWSRFAWVRIPLSVSPGIGDSDSCDLPGILEKLYQILSEIPEQTFTLRPDARDLWNDWHFEIEQMVIREPSGILRATYPKAKERAARIALITHMIDAAMSGMAPDPEISAERLGLAIEFTRWLMGQTRLMYAEFGVTDSPEAARILKFVNRFRGCGWVTAKQAIHWHSSKDKPTADKAREFMKMIVSLGYAVDNNQEGSKFQIQILENCGNSGNHPTQTQPGQGLEAVTTGGNYPVTVVTPVTESGGNADSELPEELPGYQPVTTGGNRFKPLQGEHSRQSVTELPQFHNDRVGAELDPWSDGLPNSNAIEVGSRMKYAGFHVPTAQLLRDYVLTVTALNCTVATVAAPELASPVDVAISDLEVAA